jgi:SAM-dependent methyltransferase
VAPGFKREELKQRYDVSVMHEDDWHTYSTQREAEFISRHLGAVNPPSDWLLNAGAGVHQVRLSGWREVPTDLFIAPIRNRPYAACASVEALPFSSGTFGAVVCVGEVLAYCDPALAIAEFARVLLPSGILICNFGSSRSLRYWFCSSYGRAADLVTDFYNGGPEPTWVYDPLYVCSILTSAGFEVRASFGTHIWSALAQRLGLSTRAGLFLQRHFEWLRLPSAWGALTMIVAVRTEIGKSRP